MLTLWPFAKVKTAEESISEKCQWCLLVWQTCMNLVEKLARHVQCQFSSTKDLQISEKPSWLYKSALLHRSTCYSYQCKKKITISENRSLLNATKILQQTKERSKQAESTAESIQHDNITRKGRPYLCLTVQLENRTAVDQQLEGAILRRHEGWVPHHFTVQTAIGIHCAWWQQQSNNNHSDNNNCKEKHLWHFHLNHFYFEDDGFRPWPNLPTGPLSIHIR